MAYLIDKHLLYAYKHEYIDVLPTFVTNLFGRISRDEIYAPIRTIRGIKKLYNVNAAVAQPQDLVSPLGQLFLNKIITSDIFHREDPVRVS